MALISSCAVFHSDVEEGTFLLNKYCYLKSAFIGFDVVSANA